ncbi:MAG: hypothetical protein WC489_06830 [Patescibacteria group bacterium]
MTIIALGDGTTTTTVVAGVTVSVVARSVAGERFMYSTRHPRNGQTITGTGQALQLQQLLGATLNEPCQQQMGQRRVVDVPYH